MNAQKTPPTHPGEILQEEFLEPIGISQHRLAKNLSVPPWRINETIETIPACRFLLDLPEAAE